MKTAHRRCSAVALSLCISSAKLSCAFAVGVRAAAAAREARKSWPTKRDFLERLSGDSGVATVLDVGANDGAWTREMMRLTKTNDVRFILVEPQTRFHESLRALAATRPGSTLLAGAAWTHSGDNLTLSAPRDSRAASVVSDRQQKQRASDGIVVPTIDLAALLLALPHLHSDTAGRSRASRYSRSASLAYLHLDIEGAEFAILPSLLLSRALCRLTHLHVEWHLPSLAHASPADLSGGIGVRMGLETLLERGCRSANDTHHPAAAAATTTTTRADHEHEARLLPPSRARDGGSGGAGSPVSTARPRVMVDHEESTGAGASHAMALKALAHPFPVPNRVK